MSNDNMPSFVIKRGVFNQASLGHCFNATMWAVGMSGKVFLESTAILFIILIYFESKITYIVARKQNYVIL